MKVFFNNLITSINNLDPLVKVLIIGLLLILDIMCVVQIIKTHVNPKKYVLKISQFLLLAILLAFTVFFCIHV